MDTEVTHGSNRFGNTLIAAELDGVRISELSVSGGLRVGDHSHDEGQIIFVLEGNYHERHSASDHLLIPGMVHVRTPRVVHAVNVARDERVLELMISIERSRWIWMSRRAPLTGDVLLDLLLRQLRDELRRNDDLSHPTLDALVTLVASRLCRLSDVEGTEPLWLRDALALIERRYREPLSAQDIAAATGIHPTTVAANFRRFCKASVGETLRRVRIRHAMDFLANGKAPISEIALDCGFFDQAHFARTFRRHTGRTPHEYRRTQKNPSLLR